MDDVKVFQLPSKLKKLHFDIMTSSYFFFFGGGASGSKYYSMIY